MRGGAGMPMKGTLRLLIKCFLRKKFCLMYINFLV